MSFYSPFHPLWGNPDIIALDLTSMVADMSETTLMVYMYQASLDAWRGIKKGNLWSIPDVNLTLDEMLEAGYSEDMVAAIECYVRWRTQYLILANSFPGLAMGGVTDKSLGDFKISRRGSVADLKSALDSLIRPNMDACYMLLAGVFKTKGMPGIVQRASNASAVYASIEGRRHMPPAFQRGRNWER